MIMVINEAREDGRKTARKIQCTKKGERKKEGRRERTGTQDKTMGKMEGRKGKKEERVRRK